MRDLSRLLSPRSIAILGGDWAGKVVRECLRYGFEGEVWPVHPTRETLGGVRAYSSLSALPRAPDATFIGVNRNATIEVVRELSAMGAGGAVVFASGFAEAGGADLQDTLLEAAGDMPVLGPNCYGFINALDRAVVWPDEQGTVPVERGVAVISQSSNIAITLTMQRRGLPVAYTLCVGNAAQIGLAELMEGALADPRVTALGLYVEGFGDTARFAEAVQAARTARKGIVVLKAGQSEAGRRAAVTHTAALTGDGAVASAFLSRIGAGEVSSLPELVETLGILHRHGPLPGTRLVSVSCSGGEAGLMADAGARAGVVFPDIPAGPADRLSGLLGPLVTVSNPLDYQTFIWGDEAVTTDVFSAAIEGFDAGLFVFDPPRIDRCDPGSYDATYAAMGAAQERTGVAVFTVSSLHDSVDDAVMARLDALNVTPLRGIDEALAAIRAAAVPARADWAPVAVTGDRATEVLSEGEAKALLCRAGIAVPQGVTAGSVDDLDHGAVRAPWVLKGMGFAHKTEAGAVRLDLTDAAQLEPMEGACGYLLEEMVQGGVAEVLIGVARDPVFGAVLTLGAGGTEAEVLADVVSLVCPVDAGEVADAFRRLKLWPLFDGYRGRPRADLTAAVGAVLAVQDMVLRAPDIEEIEINPLILRAEGGGAIAADALIRRAK